MSRRIPILLAGAAALAIAVTPAAVAQDEKPTVAFQPGIEDPFYHVLESGVQAASADFGITPVISQYPATWGVTAQEPPLSALIARGDVDYLLIAPVSAEEMVAPLMVSMSCAAAKPLWASRPMNCLRKRSARTPSP